ncbi:MAG: hypothetical protein ACO3U3_14670 [Alphaproteobacteria bacterium]
MSIFDLFDKRAKFLKKEQHPLAERALHLYYGGDDRSYCYFCGATGSDDNDWDAFKTWILNWVLGGRIDDSELLQVYLNWVEHENFLTESTIESITSFWGTGGPPAFNKKDNVSGQFWIFAAFAEQTA